MRTSLIVSLVSFGFVPAFIAAGCADSFEDCNNTLSCPEDIGDGDGSGGSGDGDGETGGSSVGGEGGEPSGSACESGCADGEVCDEGAGECVTCVDNDDCDGGQLCTPEKDACVACLENSHCSADASLCVSGACEACVEDADCAHIEGANVCDAGTCVQCTASNYSACGIDTGDTGNPFVCDALTNTCSATATEGGVSLCQECISNANCQTGQACVTQMEGDSEIGNFCFWVEGAGGGAPANCALNARPYVDQLFNTETIDGTTENICGLEETTCPGLSDYRDKECDPAKTPEENECGVPGLADGYCGLFAMPDVYRCTISCLSDDDCPGTGADACQPGTPNLCEL